MTTAHDKIKGEETMTSQLGKARHICVEADRKRDLAERAYQEAYEAYEKAGQARIHACRARDDAWRAYNELCCACKELTKEKP